MGLTAGGIASDVWVLTGANGIVDADGEGVTGLEPGRLIEGRPTAC